MADRSHQLWLITINHAQYSGKHGKLRIISSFLCFLPRIIGKTRKTSKHGGFYLESFAPRGAIRQIRQLLVQDAQILSVTRGQLDAHPGDCLVISWEWPNNL